MPLYELGEKKPLIGENVWVAPNASVIGDVRLGAEVSIWWGAVLRGDNEPITIGNRSNIQDNSVLHTDEGIPLTIGSNVTAGHMVILHGSTIGDNCLIGMGSVVMNGSVIGKHSIVGANALIPERRVFPERSLIVGTPGRVIRELTDDEIAFLENSAGHYVENARRFYKLLKPL